MPALFEVRSAAGPAYAVKVERGGLAAAMPRMNGGEGTDGGGTGGGGVVVADDHFAALFEARGVPAIALPATEATKSLDSIGEVVVRLRRAGATRGTHLWAVGGGAIQDAAAFVASIYMRGIAWTYVPTTLLGMVDSCIGGKSSVNVGAYKNIVGTFHPPRAVLVDPTLTATLTAEQRVAGLAEAAKITFCRGPEAFREYLSHDPRPGMAPEAFEPVIALSLASKRWFVEVDEFDRAERLLLNLGHTFGHALEGASGYRLAHGVAVGVGVLCALAMSRATAGPDGPPGGEAARLEAHMRGLLAELPDLPGVLRGVDLAATLDRLRADKKHEAAHYRFVLVDPSGAARLVRLPRSEAADRAAEAALRDTLDSLTAAQHA